MVSQIDQEAADALAALHRWMALQMQKLIAHLPPGAGPVDTEPLIELSKIGEQAANLLHLYLQALKAQLQREAAANPFKNAGG